MFSLSEQLNNLPSFQISDYINALKAMRVTCEIGELPCKIVSADRQIQWQIPEQPVDYNTMITDTLIKSPYQVNVNCFVLEKDRDNFLNLIEKGQKSESGFTLTLLNGAYSNLRVTAFSFSENSDISNGFIYSLSLKEIILSRPSILSISALNVDNKSFASTENLGKQVSNQSTDKTILKSITDNVGNFVKGLFK